MWPLFKDGEMGNQTDDFRTGFVGYDSALGEVIVAHQGTNTSEILADLTDADIIRGTLDSTLFPGISSSITVHEGFRNEQAKYGFCAVSAPTPLTIDDLVIGPRPVFLPQ